MSAAPGAASTPGSAPAPGPAPAGAAAARVGDPTGHPGTIGSPGVDSVLIGGRPAATVGTPHTCAVPPPAVHAPSGIGGPGSSTVLIGGRPAARVGDRAACGSPVVSGCPTVLIGG